MKRTAALLTLIAASTGALASTNLLVNGSFEDNVVASGEFLHVPSINGWSLLAAPKDVGFELRNNLAGKAQHGHNFIELDSYGNTTIGQTVDGLTDGQTYNLSFWYSPRQDVPANSNGIDVFWNGTQLGSTITAKGADNGNRWTQYSFTVTAGAGANLLSFAAVGKSDMLGGGLDNVSLTSPVPEPSGMALSLAGLGSLWLLRRRRAR
ncbi:MAG: PEP-CTERM sorting domain-containing protein [Roseateles sp.]|uniref:PEP-CTERM sorting domain-containing protein n=1 Tax=Roseateles sp. TaxID=1971397 RepID=UPI0039E7AA76